MLLLCNILAWILTKLGRRRIIYDHIVRSDPYLLRHYIFGARFWFGGNRQFLPIPANQAHRRPKNHKRLMISLHNILKSDGDTQHSHPATYFALVLTGGYFEHTQTGKHWRGPGSFRIRCLDSFHRIEVPHDRPVYTLFIMFKRQSDWFFLEGESKAVPHQIHLGETEE